MSADERTKAAEENAKEAPGDQETAALEANDLATNDLESRDLALSLERSDADGELIASLYFERVGPPQASSVYYLHGGPGYNSSSFRELVGDDLVDFDVIYADARGGGRSSGAGGTDVDQLAEDVRAVLAALQITTVVLLAHGFGAMVAAQVAALDPQLVRRIVMINPWISMARLARDLNDAALRRSGQVPDDDRTRSTDTADITGTRSSAAEDDADDTAVSSDPAALAAEAFALVNPKVLFDDLEFTSPAARLRLEHVDAVALSGELQEEVEPQVWAEDRLQALRNAAEQGVEIVVISGANDGTSYPSQAELVLERAPAALFSLLDGAHYPWLDDDEVFTAVLLEALA